MADRYAVILKQTGEVIDVKLIDGPKPEFEGDKADQYEIIEADDGIQIGMVRGGPRYQVAGFGFPEDVPVQRYGLPEQERSEKPADKSDDADKSKNKRGKRAA